ncbi:hypothetical protein AYM02_06125 [Coxiella burnetii]|uniref:hypothetical protein n=1 Tax=Coxiella burnetii TaxID=777 RepID=UPI0000DAEAE3|nr:hypothetical protein [Coxiella burnetii]ABX78208.1 hypothetical protein COXBURSA331_A1362 [Coxiella burnetii RSA 331]AML48918.1 hypothetical protein AUR58_06805 [Coxiella burnetii]ATN68839.1 hypothetical protein AYM00_06395 [Coxiella burnetii]ATN70764.1 hypothetical protein AYM02_06125 [Coxiella burnetii]ATN72680.1 hypothetical protein AYM11_05925 [Coxiella burnetii]
MRYSSSAPEILASGNRPSQNELPEISVIDSSAENEQLKNEINDFIDKRIPRLLKKFYKSTALPQVKVYLKKLMLYSAIKQTLNEYYLNSEDLKNIVADIAMIVRERVNPSCFFSSKRINREKEIDKLSALIGSPKVESPFKNINELFDHCYNTYPSVQKFCIAMDLDDTLYDSHSKKLILEEQHQALLFVARRLGGKVVFATFRPAPESDTSGRGHAMTIRNKLISNASFHFCGNDIQRKFTKKINDENYQLISDVFYTNGKSKLPVLEFIASHAEMDGELKSECVLLCDDQPPEGIHNSGFAFLHVPAFDEYGEIKNMEDTKESIPLSQPEYLDRFIKFLIKRSEAQHFYAEHLNSLQENSSVLSNDLAMG